MGCLCSKVIDISVGSFIAVSFVNQIGGSHVQNFQNHRKRCIENCWFLAGPGSCNRLMDRVVDGLQPTDPHASNPELEWNQNLLCAHRNQHFYVNSQMGISIQVWSKDHISTKQYRIEMDFQYFYKSVEAPSKDLAGHNIQLAKEVSIAQTTNQRQLQELSLIFMLTWTARLEPFGRTDKKLIAKPNLNEYNFYSIKWGI